MPGATNGKYGSYGSPLQGPRIDRRARKSLWEWAPRYIPTSVIIS